MKQAALVPAQAVAVLDRLLLWQFVKARQWHTAAEAHVFWLPGGAAAAATLVPGTGCSRQIRSVDWPVCWAGPAHYLAWLSVPTPFVAVPVCLLAPLACFWDPPTRRCAGCSSPPQARGQQHRMCCSQYRTLHSPA
jgi:hypothetical protein